MANYQYMMGADDVAKELDCSKSYAYKLVKAMNKELAEQGYITMAGWIPRAYWAKKIISKILRRVNGSMNILKEYWI